MLESIVKLKSCLYYIVNSPKSHIADFSEDDIISVRWICIDSAVDLTVIR